MLKLNAGFARKVGEVNYGSRGASVNVELELDSNLVGDQDGLLRRIRSLFDLARKSVDEELAGVLGDPKTGPRRSNGNGHERPAGRSASTSQLRAIRSMCSRKQLDPDQLANEQFGVGGLDELTLAEASGLIDELRASADAGRNGSGR